MCHNEVRQKPLVIATGLRRRYIPKRAMGCVLGVGAGCRHTAEVPDRSMAGRFAVGVSLSAADTAVRVRCECGVPACHRCGLVPGAGAHH